MNDAEQYLIIDNLMNVLQKRNLLPLLQRVRNLMAAQTPEEVAEDAETPNAQHLDLVFVRDLGPFVGSDEELVLQYEVWLDTVFPEHSFDELGSP